MSRRDEMDAQTRAVSDALDELLCRHFGITASSTNAEDFMAWLEERGYEVSPLGGWA